MRAHTAVRGRPRRARLGALVAGLSLLAALIGVRALNRANTAAPAAMATRYGLRGDATWAEGARPAPAIATLRDQAGRRFSLASLRGRTVAIVFFDSHCR